MGQTISFLAAEQKTWTGHTIHYDKQVREANLQFLNSFKDGTDIFLGYTRSNWGNINFEHWFVTDNTHFLEFGSAGLDIYMARVTINTNIRESYPHTIKRKMDKAVRDRMRHVLGMCNYSLCLRNCEHVANYVFRGRWISSQMDNEGRGVLIAAFRSHMMGPAIRLVNTFPSQIRPHIFDNQITGKMYSFIKDHYNASRFDYYLDNGEDTYNILVVGPTGGGKSHLINVFFNQPICHADVSHQSVTREIYFIRGRGSVFDFNQNAYVQRDIIVADTIGLCDTEWEDRKVINLIRGRVSSNFTHLDAVFVVFRADRLLKQHVDNIKILLRWLHYNVKNNHLKFLFVGTYADYLTEEKKAQLRSEATSIFGLRETERFLTATGEPLQSLVYTGFPPEDALNDMTKARVEESWSRLKQLLVNPGRTDRIKIGRDICNIL